MKRVICALFCAWAYAAGSNCKYVEFQLPGRQSDSLQTDLPFYLAFPESLASISVHDFLEETPTKAKFFLQASDWNSKPISSADRHFLGALRLFMEGKIREAGSELAVIASNPPAKLRWPLQIDRGLLLILFGLPKDAEKAWRAVLMAGGENGSCAEGAWRNLYSYYLASHDIKNAHGLVEQALKVAPKNKWANFAKGFLLRMLDPGDNWETFLREKSSWQDSLFEIQIAYGKFLKDKGQLAEAAKYYSRGLEGSPKNGPGWLELADIYFRLDYFVFSETCLRQAFYFGISDPYIFELYSRILQAGNPNASGSNERWEAAERVLETGFPHDLHSRSMAQLLYHVYCHNLKAEAAANLRKEFWFHFEGPRQIHQAPLAGPTFSASAKLRMPLSEITFPLIRILKTTDFYEPF